MKNFKVVLLLSLIVLAGLAIAYASTSFDITVTAQIPNASPDLAIEIKELTTANQDPGTGTDVTSMNFGALTHLLDTGAEAGVWYAKKYYCVLAYPTSFGKKYEVKSACTGLASGSNNLDSTFLLKPLYVAEDRWNSGTGPQQGAMPSGAIVGPEALAKGATSNSIYTSEAAASNRILRAYYSIPNTSGVTGFNYVPLSQPAGTYTGTVTITIAAI